ncbi:MAG: DUF1501 domain-containing protein, partial [Phycisphaerales bacterium]|nr:DUF1501 domain-containing protein [Phycisphaerales bacterium]
MNDPRSIPQTFHAAQVEAMTRRHFLGRTTCSFGAAALAGLLNDGIMAAPSNSLVNPMLPHIPATAKRVIYLHMAGSPPHLDLLDYKPLLNKRHGETAPQECYADRSAFVGPNEKVLGTPYAFDRVGGNGAWVSELLPHFKDIVDETCIIRSMHTDQFNHAPAQLLLHTGHMLQGRPSMGSWLSWGLGTENQDLPSFIVLVSGGKKPSAGTSAWSSGFLPTVHHGVQCRSGGDPVLAVTNPDGMSPDMRRHTIDAINKLN